MFYNKKKNYIFPVVFVSLIILSLFFDILGTRTSIFEFFNIAQAENKEGSVLGVFEEASEEVVLDSDNKDSVSVTYYNNKLPFNPYRVLGPIRNDGVENIIVKARASVSFDVQDEIFFFEQNADEVMPIASISKLMTALVLLDQEMNWDDYYQIARIDRREGGRIYVYLGEEIKLEDLFHLSLVGSANTATMALVHASGLTEAEFVVLMNEKAKNFGLNHTRFNDPIGLSQHNVSSARELAKLMKIALENDKISTVLNKEDYLFVTKNGRKEYVESTDRLLPEMTDNPRILAGKTGYTEAAGYCFLGKFSNQDNNDIITVVLHADTHDDRFDESKKLADWVYSNFHWEE